MTFIETPVERLTQDSATAVSSPAAETAILTTTGVQAGSLRPTKIVATLNVTEGTTGTAFVVRCRQGSGTGGIVVGAALTHTLAAAASAQVQFVFRDTSGYLAQPGASVYTITVAQTGATVAGTVNDIDIIVEQ